MRWERLPTFRNPCQFASGITPHAWNGSLLLWMLPDCIAACLRHSSCITILEVAVQLRQSCHSCWPCVVKAQAKKRLCRQGEGIRGSALPLTGGEGGDAAVMPGTHCMDLRRPPCGGFAWLDVVGGDACSCPWAEATLVEMGRKERKDGSSSLAQCFGLAIEQCLLCG